MEKVKTMDLVCFGETIDAIILSAVAEVSSFIESLDLYNLEENRRLGRVYLEIDKKVDQMIALNRHEYVYYYRDLDYLFKILKSTNRLYCAEEMEILKKAITLKEIWNCLVMIKMKMDIRLQVADFFVKNDVEQPVNTLLMSGSLDLSEKHDKSMLIQGVSLEEKLTIIVLQLNQRLGFLRYKSSVKQFVRWILHPNTDENEAKIPIGCMTNEFKCIMDHFKYFNNKLSYAEIGRYGIFTSQNGIPISASNLRNTSFKNLNTKLAIANIFTPFM